VYLSLPIAHLDLVYNSTCERCTTQAESVQKAIKLYVRSVEGRCARACGSLFSLSRTHIKQFPLVITAVWDA
jgi:hypothetical protein